MNQACDFENGTVLGTDIEFKVATHGETDILSFKSEGVSLLFLSQQVFTQDEYQLCSYAKMIANDLTLLQTFVDIVLASRSRYSEPEYDSAIRTAASNAISILNYGSRSGIFPFRFIDVRDWSGIRVPGANLNYAVLAHCNLDDADLSDSSMVNITLFGARLRRTNLTGVKTQAKAVFTVRENKILEVHPNGYVAASLANSEDTIRVFNLETDEDICDLFGHTSEVLSLTFNGDGSYLGSISRDKTLRIWNMITYECRSVLRLSPSLSLFPKGIGFSPDNTSVVVIAGRHTIGIANIDTCEWTATLQHEEVYRVDWSPTGDRILSYSEYGTTVRLWNVETRSSNVEWRIRGIGDCTARFTFDGKKSGDK